MHIVITSNLNICNYCINIASLLPLSFSMGNQFAKRKVQYASIPTDRSHERERSRQIGFEACRAEKPVAIIKLDKCIVKKEK